MDNKPDSISTENFERIAPASLDVAPISVEPAEQGNRSIWRWAVSVFTIVCITLVFLSWAPFSTNRSESVKDNTAAIVTSSQVLTNDNSKPQSPWQEAQWAKQRKLAQLALGNLLESQAQLESIAVDTWASALMKESRELAEQGDTLYHNRNYEGATNLYQQGDKVARTLLDQSEGVYKKSLKLAQVRLQESKSSESIDAFELALAIRPSDLNAQRGLQRAKLIDKIVAMKEQGADLEESNQYEDALKIYQQVLAVDPDTQIVFDSIRRVKEQIKQRDFFQLMAKGYSSLEKNQFSYANDYFKKASALDMPKEQTEEVAIALEESEIAETSYRIAQLRSVAQKYERSEQWQKAQATYQSILTIDPNLKFAKQGLVGSGKRVKLENNLLAIIANPHRLSNKAVYLQAEALLNNAQSISHVGSVLNQQRSTLARLLKRAITPVKVVLQSDGATDVVVHKVAHIGIFTNHTLTLKPGMYTVVGSRDGYRDVRQEFQVQLEKPLSPIVIQCREKIL